MKRNQESGEEMVVKMKDGSMNYEEKEKKNE